MVFLGVRVSGPLFVRAERRALRKNSLRLGEARRASRLHLERALAETPVVDSRTKAWMDF